METKQLVEKFVNGEITEQDFETEKSKLTPEEQEQLNKDAEAAMPNAVEKLKSIRRGITKITPKDNADDTGFAAKLRQENYEKARDEVFTELGLQTDDDKLAFEEGFKKFDTGGINVENIARDMKSYFVSTKPDEFFAMKKEKEAREAEAEEFNAQNGGTNGSGSGGGDGKKLSKEVEKLMKESQTKGRPMTVEQAERAIEVAKRGGRIG